VWFEVDFLAFDFDSSNETEVAIVLSSLVINIFADYASLFIIRKLLIAAGRRTALGLIASFVVGVAVIYIAYVVRAITFIVSMVGLKSLADLSLKLLNPLILMSTWEVSAPALAVHLWLPLFALAIALTQLFGGLSKAVGWMQWFLKQGQYHPFQAVGYVASVIVFVCGVVIQYVWR
jgi:hypothetical protein